MDVKIIYSAQKNRGTHFRVPLYIYRMYSHNIHQPVAGNTKSNWDICKRNRNPKI